jgi:GNAT superfamily N-acetyltransferase
MKLHHLFMEDYSVRALNDNNPLNFPNLTDPSISEAGSYDAHAVFSSFEKEHLGLVYYFITVHQTPDSISREDVMAYIMIHMNETEDGLNQFRELWVNPSARNKGYGTALIRFLTQKLQVKLLLAHDEIVSAPMRTLLKKAAISDYRKFKIKNRDGELYTVDELTTILNDIHLNDVELVISEQKSKWPLFANRKFDKDGKACLIEHYSCIQADCETEWLD